MNYVVKNWRAFQHYTGRTPPWIKLQRSILDDRDYQCLPLASKALAPMLWLLASESEDGQIDCDPDNLAWRLRWAIKDIKDGLTPLIKQGFLIPASGALAECLQDACRETEGEGEGERESMSGKPDPDIPKKLNGKKAEAIEVLEFLNAKANRAYRPTDSNLGFVVARLKEGASVADCRKVIAKKCREWSEDDKMREYLRPATLFNRTKFDQYVGELVQEAEHG